MKLEEKVFSYIEKYRMIETGSHVIVGISGGADSVCLLFLLKEYQKRADFALYGVHVNHGIRGEEAERDERFSGEICQSLGVPFTACHFSVPEIAAREKLSEEEAGRNVRRQAFRQKAEEIRQRGRQEGSADAAEGERSLNRQDAAGREGNPDRQGTAGGVMRIVTALAHHENDNAETVLHHLARGTGLAGLGGMRPVQRAAGEREESIYIRPLLGVSRAEIEEYLLEKGQTWVTDSTNQETDYTRNKIRHEILPLFMAVNEKAVSHISRTAKEMWKIEEYLQEQADMLYSKYVTERKDGCVMDKRLFEEKELMQSYVAMRALKQAAGKKRDFTSAHIEAVLSLAKGRTGASLSLPFGLFADQVYGDVHIRQTKEQAAALRELEFQVFPWENQQIPEKTYTKWFDYDKIKNRLKVRFRNPGDFLTVGAHGGKKKLKDYFIDCKIPREERNGLTLLADGSHVLWIVGYRISEYYKVTSQTKNILKVHVKGEKEDE